MSQSDDEKNRLRRERDAESARIRRAERRRAREESWRATHTTGAHVAPDMPPSVLLQKHITRCALFLERLAADEATPLAERTRIFVAAVPALARACESVEFRERLEALEQRVRRGLRGVA